MSSGSRDSKRLIARAALEEFGEFGFPGARTDRIAQRAGVNKQLLYYYFGSKQGLYDAVLSLAVEHFMSGVARASAQTTGATRPRARLRAVFQAVLADSSAVRLVVRGVLEGGAGGAGAPAQSAAKAVEEICRAISSIVSAGQGVGLFRDDIDPDMVASQAVVLLLGYCALEPALGELGSGAPDAWAEAVSNLLLRSLSW